MLPLHFIELFTVFTGLVAPFTFAATPPPARALPQDMDYAAYIAGNLSEHSFSTDPTAPLPGEVAAEITGELRAFIISPRVCISGSETPAYRVFVQNISPLPIHGITVRFIYPGAAAFVVAQPAPTREVPAEHLVEWYIPILAPGAFTDMTAQIEVLGGNSITTNVQVLYETPQASRTLFTSHTIDGPCGAYTGSFAPLPSKEPAIVCDPNESGCAPTYHLLPLGDNYRGAVEGQPFAFGPRFVEAVADIQPGECRVLGDNVVQEPQFHDALARQGEDAAPFMVPLFNSGLDFKRLVHENEMLGIENKLYAQNVLKKIHIAFIEKIRDGVVDVLHNKLPSATLRTQLDPWLQQVVADWQAAQPDLRTRYAQLQEQRKTKFDAVATQAVANARASITNACVSNTSDGGLAALLPPVKQAYLTALDQRRTAYDTTQNNFVIYAGVAQYYLPSTWKAELFAALDAFDAGNRAPLEQFLRDRPMVELSTFPGFTQAWNATYERHAKDDIARDNVIRLTGWEVALDTPKEVAAACAKETLYGASVEATWCESGNANELLLKGAPEPAKEADPSVPPDPVKDDIRPPQPINGPLNAILNQAVTNASCGGGPGDPFWAPDCSCNCNQLVANPRNGNIRFCQNEEEDLLPITRHDIYVTSTLECLTFDLQRHQDPFF